MAKIYSVGQINAYIRAMFAQDFVLNRISIRGEVSNCKYHSSGHIYFSLKDSSGTIACIMFASARKGLAFRMSDGQQVVADGSVSVYERDGKYQLYVSRIRLDGAGALYERFLALKQELEEMGMFAREYKKPIPSFVQRLGVVTAPTGAAIRDIIQISRRRNPGIQIIVYPARVQGEGAAGSVALGLAALDRMELDALIVGRGGGSIEDLWAFNEEVVARAIFGCQTPVISAVGHETDTTIADFVADLRAPTPSAAAELAVADVTALQERLDSCRRRLGRSVLHRVQTGRMELERYRMRLQYASPIQKAREQRQRLADLEELYRREMKDRIREARHRVSVRAEKMQGLSPLEKLSQGYSCAVDAQGRKIYSVRQAAPGDTIRLYVSDGELEARVTRTEQWTPPVTAADDSGGQTKERSGYGRQGREEDGGAKAGDGTGS